MNQEYKEILERSSLIAAIACGELSPELLKLSREQLEDMNKLRVNQEVIPNPE